jgi:hypothetical protein
MKMLVYLLVTLFAAVIVVSAQNTTTEIAGRVIDENGDPLTGVTIQAVHTSYGSNYGTSSNRQGVYSLSGLRPGNYKITFSFIGYKDYNQEVTLSLGEQYVLDIQLNESVQNLSAVNITAERTQFIETKTGQTMRISNKTIEQLPSINRTLLDYTRLSQYSGNDNSMAGRDGRLTTLNIDGASLNNSFGTTSALPAAGNPISIDAIDEVQVVIAPYDVRQSNFTGGGINAITKSGSNILTGSAYIYHRNQDMRGNTVDGYSLGNREKESKTTYGFTLGGPIVKNKLFFFANFEYEDQPQPISKWKLSTDGVGDADAMISRVTQADMDRFATALNKYGYKAGTTDLNNGNVQNRKILTRLDWNISDKHNLMLRYNLTNNSSWATPNNNSTVGTSAPSYRISDKGYVFRNSCYTINDDAWSAVAELNSRFSNSLSNRLLATISEVSNLRGSESPLFPYIDIWDGNGDIFMGAGYEPFSYNTGNATNTFNIKDEIRWTAGNNILAAGISMERQKAKTGYTMYGTGYYKYASLEDFEQGKAPIALGYTYPYDNVTDPMSKVSFGQYSLYVQNETRPLKNLILTYGLRADLLDYLQPIETNQPFKSLDWTAHYYSEGAAPEGFKSPVFDTGRWPNTNVQLSPRVGFNWTNNSNTLVVRGGAGLFTGRIPLVFFTNIPNYSNMLQNTVMIKDDSNGLLSGLADNFLHTNDDLKKYLTANGYPAVYNQNSPVKSATLCAVSEDFKLPQVFKTSLGIDWTLPVDFPATITAEGIYNKDINAVMTENLNLYTDNSYGRFGGADNRINYKSNTKGTNIYNNVTGGAAMLTNTNRGYSYSVSLSFNAEPVENLNVNLAYIHSESKSVSDMTGSSLYSTWKNTLSINSSNDELAKRTSYVIPDKISAYATYTLNTGKYSSTMFGLYYVGMNSGVYSYSYTNDMNGDGSSADLIYIPASKDDVLFVDNGNYTAAEQQDAFWNFVCNDPYLSKHKGEYAEANMALMPWFNRFDLRVVENIGFKVGNDIHKVQLSLDLMNATNLISNKLGVRKTASSCNNGKILTYKGVNAEGNPLYTLYSNKEGLLSKQFDTLKSSDNCWFLQFGMKYIF